MCFDRRNTTKMVVKFLARLDTGLYICNKRIKNPFFKIATNQSLNQKSRCFHIGAFFFNYQLLIIFSLQILSTTHQSLFPFQQFHLF